MNKPNRTPDSEQDPSRGLEEANEKRKQQRTLGRISELQDPDSEPPKQKLHTDTRVSKRTVERWRDSTHHQISPLITAPLALAALGGIIWIGSQLSTEDQSANSAVSSKVKPSPEAQPENASPELEHQIKCIREAFRQRTVEQVDELSEASPWLRSKCDPNVTKKILSSKNPLAEANRMIRTVKTIVPRNDASRFSDKRGMLTNRPR